MKRLMKRTGLILALSCFVPFAATAGPILSVDPEVYEWGRQTENQGMYEFSFVLSNTGDEPLKIEEVRAGCACTKVEVPKHDLAPGEKITMTGSLKTKGVEGKMSKAVILRTNDSKRTTKFARLSIRFPYSAEGMRLRSQRYSARFRSGRLYAYTSVENCEPDAYHVQGALLPEGWSIAKELPLKIDPESHTLVVLQRPIPEGTTPEPFENVSFTLITDCPKTPELTASLLFRPPKPRPENLTAAVKGDAKQAKQDGAKDVADEKAENAPDDGGDDAAEQDDPGTAD